MTKRIFRSIFCVSALVLVAGLVLMLGVLYPYFNDQLEKELDREAHYLALVVESEGVDGLSELAMTEERITLVTADGEVLYDNQADESSMDNHLNREEIQEALSSGDGYAIRRSQTLAEETVYYALRLSNGQVLRVSSTQYSLLAILFSLLQPLIWIFLLLLLLSGLFAARASKKIVAPINRLNLEHPEENQAYEEISPLLTKILQQQKTIRAQLAEAKRQQQNFALITENMSEGLLVIGSQTEVLSYNHSACRLLRVSGHPDCSSVLSWNRSEPFRQGVNKALQGEAYTEVLTLSGERPTDPEDAQYLRLTVSPVLQSDRPAGAVLLLVDVTEKQQREQLRREFTANVSHELKTPLTSISGYAEIIQNGLVQPQDIPEFAGRIFAESQRLITLVGDIIKISQLDEGALPCDSEEIDLSALLHEVADSLQAAADKQQVVLSVKGEHLSMRAVKPILHEILYNLCDNAIKYNRPGGAVTLSAEEKNGSLLLTVSDTGVGIAPEYQGRIFERFYRVDKSHSQEIGGTGLGLSIVKHGAAFLGATLHMTSQVDKGTTFTLEWPASRPIDSSSSPS